MDISELFKELENNISNILNGELVFKKNSIIWSYDIERNGTITEDDPNEEENDEFEYCFSSVNSSEEILLENYNEDLSTIETYIAELDDHTNWSFSDPEIGKTIISFKIS